MNRNFSVKIVLLFMMFLFFTVGLVGAEQTILVGEVNDNYQIVADGQLYEIADTEKGNELVDNHVGARVEVVGTVEEVDEMKILTIVSFKVLTD